MEIIHCYIPKKFVVFQFCANYNISLYTAYMESEK